MPRWEHAATDEMQDFLTVIIAVHGEPILRDVLPRHNLTKVYGEVRKPCQAATLLIELTKRERPPAFLTTTVLAHHAVEPTLNTAGEIEVGRINCQNQTLVKNALVKPGREDKLKTKRVALGIFDCFPTFQPTKLTALVARALSDTGFHACGLQPSQSVLKPLIVPTACPASNK